MSRIDLVKESHPALSDEDISLLLCIGYKADADMDDWTQTLKDNPIEKLMNVISLVNSAKDGN